MPVCPNGHSSEDPEYCDTCGLRMDMPMDDLAPSPDPPSANPPGDDPLPAGPSSASSPGATPPPAGSPLSGPSVTGEFAAAEPPPSPDGPVSGFCARCGTVRPLDARFCEVCGGRFETARGPSGDEPARAVPRIPQPRAGSGPLHGWTAVINADRAYYNSVIAQDGPDAAALDFPPYSPERHVPLQDREVWIGRHSESRSLTPAIDLGEPPADPGVSHLHAILNAREDGTWTVTDQGSTNGTTMNGEVESLKAMVPVEVREGDRIHVGAWTTITLTRQGGP